MPQPDNEIRITRVRLENFGRFDLLEFGVPAAGVEIVGRSDAGKSTCLEAVRAALGAVGVPAGAIRDDAAKARIEVDLGDLTVERILRREGRPAVAITGPGAPAGAPQTFLDGLLGSTLPLDPISFYAARPPERRKQLLAALPATVTPEWLRRYCPEVPDTFPCGGHGFEVIEHARSVVYEKRKALNAEARVAASERDRLREVARSARAGARRAPGRGPPGAGGGGAGGAGARADRGAAAGGPVRARRAP